MNMFKPMLFLSLFFIGACACTTDEVSHQPKGLLHWQYLILEFNDTVIHASKSIDTLELETFKEGVQKFPISQPDMDSLVSWSNELIGFQGQPDHFCTDYICKMKVRIRYNSQLFKEVEFSSVCNWREISIEINQIGQLLKKKVSPK